MPQLKQSTQTTKITLHPAALAAHTWSRELHRWFNRSALPETMRKALAQQPLQCIATPSTLELYAPLWTIVLWQSDQPPIGTLLVCLTPDEISEAEIERAAWVSVLGEVFNSLHPHGISDLRDTLKESMSHGLHRELFNAKMLNDNLMCKWTGISRAALGEQRRRNRTQASPPATTQAIINALNQPWGVDD